MSLPGLRPSPVTLWPASVRARLIWRPRAPLALARRMLWFIVMPLRRIGWPRT
jgi:hypothetical protein